jgi:hypothetical protein
MKEKLWGKRTCHLLAINLYYLLHVAFSHKIKKEMRNDGFFAAS